MIQEHVQNRSTYHERGIRPGQILSLLFALGCFAASGFFYFLHLVMDLRWLYLAVGFAFLGVFPLVRAFMLPAVEQNPRKANE